MAKCPKVRLELNEAEQRSSPTSLSGYDPFGYGDDNPYTTGSYDPNAFGSSNPFNYDPFYGSFGTNFYRDPFYADLSAYDLDASDPFYTDPLASELFLNDPFLGTPAGFESLFSDTSQFGIADFDRLDNYGIDDSGYDYSSFAPGGADSYFAIGADAGSPGVASLVGSNGAEKVRVAAYDSSAQGVRVATGDVDGDRVPDLITAPGPGSAPLVKVFSGSDGHLIKEFMAFEATFTGGVFVAAADLNQDGLVDIAITPDQGGGPRCKIVDGGSLGTMSDFLGIDDGNFRGGARAAFGDVGGDGLDDLVVSAGFGGGPRIAIYDGSGLSTNSPFKLANDFFAFEDSLRNGAYVSAGDLTNDGHADLIFGGGPGGAPRVRALDGNGVLGGVQTDVANFFAGDQNDRSGVRVGVAPDTAGNFGIYTANSTTTSRYDLAGTSTGTFDPYAGTARGAYVSSAPTTSKTSSTAVVAGKYRNRATYVTSHNGFGNSRHDMPRQDVTVTLANDGTGSVTIMPFGYTGRGITLKFRYNMAKTTGGYTVRVPWSNSSQTLNLYVVITGKKMIGTLEIVQNGGKKSMSFTQQAETPSNRFQLTKV